MEIPPILAKNIEEFIKALNLKVDKEQFTTQTILLCNLFNNKWPIKDVLQISKLKPTITIADNSYIDPNYYALALAHAKSQRKETLKTKEAVIDYLESIGIIIETTSDNKTNQELIEKIKTYFSVPYFRQKYGFQLERQKPSFKIKDIESFMELAGNNYIKLKRGQNIFALFGEIATRHNINQIDKNGAYFVEEPISIDSKKTSPEIKEEIDKELLALAYSAHQTGIKSQTGLTPLDKYISRFEEISKMQPYIPSEEIPESLKWNVSFTCVQLSLWENLYLNYLKNSEKVSKEQLPKITAQIKNMTHFFSEKLKTEFNLPDSPLKSIHDENLFITILRNYCADYLYGSTTKTEELNVNIAIDFLNHSAARRDINAIFTEEDLAKAYMDNCCRAYTKTLRKS